MLNEVSACKFYFSSLFIFLNFKYSKDEKYQMYKMDYIMI